MRILAVAVLRKPLLTLLVLVIAGVTLAIVQPWKAPESSDQARVAERDSVWKNPAATFVERRYVVRADAAWVPWGNHTTTVGRWYRETGSDFAADRAEWLVVAARAGWTPSAEPGCAGHFIKKLGKWMALLTVAPDPTGRELGVRIAFPSADDAAAQDCRP